MSKRTLLILVSGIVLSTALLLPSFKIRAIAAFLVLLAIALWLLIKFNRQNPSTHIPNLSAGPETDEQSETFGRGLLFEATIGGMQEGLLVVDRDMRVVTANPAAYKVFTSTSGKLDSQRLTELTRNPAIYSAFLDALKGIERTGVKVETHGPERQVFDLRVVPLGSANGAGSGGALGIFFDITRTERLELVRQEFLSNVSHELRTPLTAILAFVETLESGALDDKESSHRFLSIIRKNASRMRGLIDDILELTAIEGGNVELRVAPVELHALVNDVFAALGAQALGRRISLINEVEPRINVIADSRRLEQMLTNLIDNGIKFGREHGQVTIRCLSGVRDRIMVMDNGEGIPAQHLERLFERFYRIDRARSKAQGGTGLGLAIVKHLALLHGGEVSVESELGKGTTFTIHLPRQVNFQ